MEALQRELRPGPLSHPQRSDEFLLEIAHRTLASASPVTQEYLRLICFDDDWLAPERSQEGNVTASYMVVLGKFVHQCAPLANLSFAILEAVLPMFGWEQHQINLLLIGRSLRLLMQETGLSQRNTKFASDIRHISWMQRTDVGHMDARLNATRVPFVSPTEMVTTAVDEIIKTLGQKASTEQALNLAYSQIQRRMELGERQGLSLLLINDVNSYTSRPGPSPIDEP